MRTLLVAAALLFGSAPMQCGSSDAEDGRAETPPEALFGLAERFKAEGKTEAYERTLKYLMERYPNSRFAKRAEHDLAHEK